MSNPRRMLWFPLIVLTVAVLFRPTSAEASAEARPDDPPRRSPGYGAAVVGQWDRDNVGGQSEGTAIRPSDVLTFYIYLPFVAKPAPDPCQSIPGESYGTLSVNPPPTDRPAAEHAGLNLGLRGYEPTNAYQGLVDYSGGSDPNAPQFPSLFTDNRVPTFTAVYQLYAWDWDCNCQSQYLITQWDVTLAELSVSPVEIIHVPSSGYDIGDGYQVLVLYATTERITLKYTREDNVVYGYTVHVENVCVEPTLLALYESWNDAGRGRLPALRSGQAFGRARSDTIKIAVRDTGMFMDPRSRKDWWQGR